MQCRQCGTEIADKALICYRCGTATTEAKYKAAVPARRRRGPGATIALILVVLLIILLALYLSGQLDAILVIDFLSTGPAEAAHVIESHADVSSPRLDGR